MDDPVAGHHESLSSSREGFGTTERDCEIGVGEGC